MPSHGLRSALEGAVKLPRVESPPCHVCCRTPVLHRATHAILDDLCSMELVKQRDAREIATHQRLHEHCIRIHFCCAGSGRCLDMEGAAS